MKSPRAVKAKRRSKYLLVASSPCEDKGSGRSGTVTENRTRAHANVEANQVETNLRTLAVEAHELQAKVSQIYGSRDEAKSLTPEMNQLLREISNAYTRGESTEGETFQQAYEQIEAEKRSRLEPFNEFECAFSALRKRIKSALKHLP